MSPRVFLAGTLRIAGRELGAAFDSGIAQVSTIALAVLANSLFLNEFFLTGNLDMSGFFELLPPLLAFFLPALSMRLWAEERRHRTMELLLTLPIVPLQAVLGKYLAGLCLHGLFLASSLPIVVMLEALGDPDRGLLLSGYAGLFLFGALYLAFGSLLSAISRDQIVAFTLSAIAGYALVLVGDDRVVEILDGLAPALEAGTFLRDRASVMPHYEALVRGVVEASTLLYFGLFSAVFLWTTGLVVERVRT